MEHDIDPETDVCRVCKCSLSTIQSFGWGCRNTKQATKIGSVSAQSKEEGLFHDLKTYAGEFYRKGDAKAGMKLVLEIVGAASLLLLAGKAAFILTGGKSNYILNKAFIQLANGYTKLNAADRKAVRAFVTLGKTGFGLFGR